MWNLWEGVLFHEGFVWSHEDSSRPILERDWTSEYCNDNSSGLVSHHPERAEENHLRLYLWFYVASKERKLVEKEGALWPWHWHGCHYLPVLRSTVVAASRIVRSEDAGFWPQPAAAHGGGRWRRYWILSYYSIFFTFAKKAQIFWVSSFRDYDQLQLNCSSFFFFFLVEFLWRNSEFPWFFGLFRVNIYMAGGYINQIWKYIVCWYSEWKFWRFVVKIW